MNSHFDPQLAFDTKQEEMKSYLTSLLNSRTKKLRFVIVIAAFIICIWIIFFPRPYYWAVGVGILFMPILIFSSLMDRDRFEFQEPKSSDASRVNFLGPFGFVLCALMIRGAADLQITDDFEVLKLIIPIGFTIALIGWVILKRANFPLLLVISLCYSLPLVLELNDWGPSTDDFVIMGPIVRTYTSTRPLSQTIVIRFNHEEKHVHVSREAFQRYSIGDTACAKEQKGWLGIGKLITIRCL